MPKRKKANAAAWIVDDPAALSAAVTRLSADLLSARTELANLRAGADLVCKTLNETSAELQAVKDHCDGVIRQRDEIRAAYNALAEDNKAANSTRAKLVLERDEAMVDLDAESRASDALRKERDELHASLAASIAQRNAGITPPPLGKGTCFGCRWAFAIDGAAGAGSIEIVNKGAGHYVELTLNEPLQMDGAEFLALAKWAAAACEAMDRANGEGNQ